MSSRELKFRPLWPMNVQAHEPNSPIRVTFSTQNMRSVEGRWPHDSPPPYIPSVLLQVDVPWPLVLYGRKPVNVGISVTVPSVLQRSLGKVFLLSLSIRLQRVTIASIAGNERSHSDTMAVCGFSGLVPIDVHENLETVALPDTFWRTCVIPETAPSFRCFALEIKYEVEIIANFSSDGGESVQVRLSRKS